MDRGEGSIAIDFEFGVDLHLFPSENQALLHRWDPLLLLDALFYL